MRVGTDWKKLMKPLKQRIEALLFTRDVALNENLLATALNVDVVAIKDALQELAAAYAHSAMELQQVASGWRLQLRPEYQNEITALAEIQPPRYSRAFWETLAFIAYNQPVTRADIDKARAVQTSSNIYQQLFHLEWIEVIGRKKAIGNPELLAVTQRFLDDFGLRSANKLPPIEGIDYEN